ncbi:ATP synthase F0 subunit B [Patescibacteria group bacterium]|nr:ATP synthase F0 subunit B [Patescibacteria group bacterium]
MQEIINAFGIDWRLIVIQIFNFALLLTGLWYFLYTPVLTMLEKRQKTIEKGLADAALAEQALTGAETEKAAIVKAAHDEATAVSLRAKAYADEKSAALVREAEEKTTRMMEEAKKAGLELQNRLYKESEAEIARTALLAAEKILKQRA